MDERHVTACVVIIMQVAEGPRFNEIDDPSALKTYKDLFQAIDDYRQDYMEAAEQLLGDEVQDDGSKRWAVVMREEWDEALRRVRSLNWTDFRNKDEERPCGVYKNTVIAFGHSS